MTSPTRQQIIDAYTAVTTLARLAEEFTPVRVEEHKEINDLHLAVRAALPPRPQPTMAEVEWDNCKHHFAEAIHPNLGQVIMLSKNVDTGDIFCDFYTYGEQYFAQLNPKNLTPTGKRYTLTEVQE
jgi:hypothetical protein